MSKNNVRIFVVEDDPSYRRMIEYVLQLNPDFEVVTFENGRSCMDKLHLRPDIVTLDYSLPDSTGADVLKRIVNTDPSIKVLILSGQTDVKTAVGLLRQGAYDYITKDEETKDKLINTIHHILQNKELSNEVSRLKEELGKKYEFQNVIIGKSGPMEKVFKLMEKAVATDITVSVYGETGTGKEMVAKAIHYNSKRGKGPFIAVNVAAIPSELIESELFGHEKGAFTGANTRRIGKFEEANGGTIFLDEIGEMDTNMQAKILRVLQERELVRVGGNAVVKLNARIICATHRDLKGEVEKGKFREDLYYRLLGLPVHLPPLRDRSNDILILAKHFVDEFCKDNGMEKATLEQGAQAKLLEYPWPGNVRELKAVVELAAVMCSDNRIEAGDVSFHNTGKSTDFLMEELTLRDYTNRIIEHFLHKYDNNVVHVAEKLDMGKSTIYRMIKNGDVKMEE
ncbi:MAG: sigma-54-dependent Fis family transcriptional regulator [Bacteroidetes bacterium]|jgi:DNA-binding NtrC family response regulator|nr:sigma-54-dependent Fis family transcriptional regulator [Bacteroidota bacterium]